MAKSATLKADAKGLSNELAKLAKEEAAMGKIRQETHAYYVQVKADYGRRRGASDEGGDAQSE